MRWVKSEGGIEGPTQLTTVFQPHQKIRMDWLKRHASGRILELGCVLPGTNIVTQGGVIPIEQVALDTQVLTHQGRFRPVIGRSVRPYSGLVQGVRRRYGFETVWMTPEHPIWTQPVARQYPTWPARPTGDACWIAAGNLTKDCWPLYPVLTGDTEPLLHFTPVTSRGRGRAVAVRRQVNVTPAVAELVGRFVGDGFSRRGEISICFNLAERPDAERLAAIVHSAFGVKPRDIRPGCGIIHWTCYSASLARFFQTLGHRAQQKHLPMEWLSATPEILKAAIKGLMESDGTEKDGRFDLSTTSITLAWQVQALLLRLGIPASMSLNQRPTNFSLDAKCYHVRGQTCPQRPFGRFFSQGHGAQVLRLEQRRYRGPVYNLAIAEDESYCTPSLALHNCNFGLVLAWVGGHAGVDINPMNIELAKLLAPDREFHVADILDLPFPDKSFDCAMLPEVLEHLDFPDGVRRALTEAERVTKSTVLVTMPDGRQDSDDACNFKHLYLLDEERAQTLLGMMPGAVLKYQKGFALVHWQLDTQRSK